MIRRRNVNQQQQQQEARFASPYCYGPRGLSQSNNSSSYIYTRRTELTRAAPPTYFA